MTSLREACVDEVLNLETVWQSGASVPTVSEYVDTVLAVVRTRLAAVVTELHANGDLTPAGARAVHRVLDAAEVTT